MNALSAYMAAAGTRALPDEVVEQAKYHLLDTFAAMISGSELPPGQAAQRYIREHGGKGSATIVASALTAATTRCGAGQRRDGAFGRNRRFAQ